MSVHAYLIWTVCFLFAIWSGYAVYRWTNKEADATDMAFWTAMILTIFAIAYPLTQLL